MPSSTEIRVPRETVNDDFVTIADWHVKAGDRVRAKDVVVSIETSKAVLEVEPGVDGYVEIVHPAGAEVAIGEVIGHVHSHQIAVSADGATPTAGDVRSAQATGSTSGDHKGPAGATISRKAQALVDEHGIDPAVFAGKGLIRESDVIGYLQEQQAVEEGSRPAATAAPVEAAAGAPLLKLAPSSTVTLLGDLKVSAQERGAGIFSVIINYLWRTWLLGNLVQWAPRGIILPLHRLRGVKMGKGCFIDPSAIVETAYPENITLGDDVRITARVVIMTHIKAPHYLRNTGIMPAVVKPVVLKDQCFIGVNSVIMPGVTVGKAAVVASGSVVVSNVSPYTMVAGNPAKLVKRFPNPEPERVSDEQRRV